MSPLVLTFNFYLILGLFFAFGGPNGLFLSSAELRSVRASRSHYVCLSVEYSTHVCGIFHKRLWNTPGFKLQAFQQYIHILYPFTRRKLIDNTCVAANSICLDQTVYTINNFLTLSLPSSPHLNTLSTLSSISSSIHQKWRITSGLPASLT